MLMSSGTEDYFGSSFYFSGVPDGFTSANAGLTHLDYNASEGGLAFSAYKVHDRDAFMWPAQTAVNITWRNGGLRRGPGGLGAEVHRKRDQAVGPAGVAGDGVRLCLLVVRSGAVGAQRPSGAEIVAMGRVLVGM
jgi:hypothetical protein